MKKSNIKQREIYNALIGLLALTEVYIPDSNNFKSVRFTILDIANDVLRLGDENG
ncbi:MAG: hypothetical protein M0P10_06470 [Sphaerochaetaceae bacterium]|jgi:hypothetical protein|nr:hypothetical protein [Sphaerochaetaceae bacterium]